jgi:hypothetical protein
MGCELSVAARVEITQKYARAYARASKRVRGGLLDEVVAVTGWSRDNARRRLSAAAKPGPRSVRKSRAPRPRKFSYDATKTLQRVWAFSGGQCGKYLAAVMETLLDALERHGELVFGKGRYSPEVREELLGMSPATIDRYLATAKAKDPLRASLRRNRHRCCGTRSPSARPVTRSKMLRGSSRATRSRTAGRR